MKLIRSLLTFSGVAAAAALAFAVEGHDHAAQAPASDKYPLTTCIVSGDKLGEMGDPVKYTYKQAGKPDRVIEFCCKDCIKDFEKDPAKYLAKLDAAAAGGATTSAKPSACCGDATMSCGADEAGCGLVKTYLPIAEALAADDLGKAQAAAASLAKEADAAGQKNVYQPALALVHATDLKAARAAFKSLSKEIVPMAEKSKDLVVMNCPMANADWVQTDSNVRNPYYGKMMLTCGAPKTATK
jgi:hypothetical protein